MRITEKQYLAAIEIIKLYAEQISREAQAAERVPIKGETLRSWALRHHYELSSRLFNILMANSSDDPLHYNMSSLDKDGFLKFRNAGEKSWDEFINIRDREK